MNVSSEVLYFYAHLHVQQNVRGCGRRRVPRSSVVSTRLVRDNGNDGNRPIESFSVFPLTFFNLGIRFRDDLAFSAAHVDAQRFFHRVFAVIHRPVLYFPDKASR